MRYFFFDASALVKGFCFERGEQWVRGAINNACADPPSCRIVIADFTLVEAISAINQKLVDRRISRKAHATAIAHLSGMLQGVVPCPFVLVAASGVMAEVSGIMGRYSLRPGDAIHLSAALAARASIPVGSEFTFVSSDGPQIDAARAENFETFDPAEREYL